MLTHRVLHLLAVLTFCCPLVGPSLRAARPDRPNVILIMTDNHGAWTLGCYGNPDIRTPNIDRLAAEGTLFRRAFASNPVCSPTRATCLTGLLPSQHGVHCFLRGGRLQVGPDVRNTLEDLTSLPEILRSAGYNCGLVGKWHLGDNLRPQEGLDDYWITMPHGGTSTFYDAQVIEDGKIRRESTYLTDFWTQHAVKFIEQNKDGQKPFFLFLSYNGPYSLSRLLLREGRNRHAAYYADKTLSSFPREPTHPWQYSNRDYINNPVSMRRVATEVSGVDDGVGSVLDTLQRYGLDENTLIVFVADQGWVGGHGGFWGMGDHTRPLTAFDGMMRIPMIWRQPGKIARHRQSNLMVSNYDLMPSMLSYLGLAGPGDAEPQSPGRDFSKALMGQPVESWDNTVFYEFEDTRAIRTSAWKYVHRQPNGPQELYDLVHDPSEQNNLVRQPAQEGRRRRLKRRLDQFFDQYAEPKYDLWNGGGSQTAIFHPLDEELAQVQSAEPPPLPADFEIPQFTVPDGYTVELVAGPPLVQHPLMASFDEQGRLYIAEAAGLNLAASDLEKQLPNFVRRLEDTDGDGRFDRSTIFADQMTFPQGALWYDGALYVASPPNIWRLEDTDDDGVADRRQILVDKFGYTGNAASVHGCFLGPNGRIYWCDGRHGHEFRDEDGNLSSQGEGSYIFSCNPDGSDPRAHCGGGMDNPVEVDFTNEGEVLGTVNIMYTRPRIDTLVHWLHGGVYPHSERVLGEFQRTGELLGPIHEFGHVAVSGMTRYRSGVLDRRFRDNIFVSIFNTGKILRVELEREGSTFRAAQHEFFECAGRDFHPTDVLEDADGSLLVIDTGGWFRKGCPTSQIAKPQIKGGIYRVRREGATPLVDPRGRRIAWDQLSGAEAIALLNDTRFTVRERAILECAKRGDAIVPSLASTLSRRDSRQRRNALWALTRIGSEAAKAAVRPALHDPSPSVRLAACTSISTSRDAAAVSQLVDLLDQDDAPVRRQAAEALGRIGDRRAVPALLTALGEETDRSEQHALIYALIEINDPQSTAVGLSSRNASSRCGALIALDQMTHGELQPDVVTAALRSDDEPLQRAALDIVTRRREWAPQVARLLEQQLEHETMSASTAQIVQGLATAFISDHQVARRVATELTRTDAAPNRRRLLLSALAQGHALPLQEDLQRALLLLLESEDNHLLQETTAAVAAFDTEQFDERLKRIAENEDRPTLLRVAALEAVSGKNLRLSHPGFALLMGLLAATDQPVQRLHAAQMIGGASLSKQQLLALTPQLALAGPLRIRELIKPFEGNSDAEVGRAFLRAVEQSEGFWSLLPSEVWHKVHRCPPEITDLAAPLVEKLQQQEDQKQQRLAQLHDTLKSGDAASGHQVFHGEKAKCAVCHRVGEKGGQIGPDLTRIGRIRSGRDLLEAVVFPSSSFAREFQPYAIVTSDGKVNHGIISQENATTIHLQAQLGNPLVIRKDDVDEIAPSAVSIMPQGLDKVLSQQELADLVAYLNSLN